MTRQQLETGFETMDPAVKSIMLDCIFGTVCFCEAVRQCSIAPRTWVEDLDEVQIAEANHNFDGDSSHVWALFVSTSLNLKH